MKPDVMGPLDVEYQSEL